MKNNPINEGVISENFAGIGPVSRTMVNERAAELAQIEGRLPMSVSQSDYEQAKRELTGESDIDRQEAVLDSFSESKRWDPVPGSTGHETPGSLSEDMDDEGRSIGEQLVLQGLEEAEHDQMLQSARVDKESDRRQP